MIQKRLEESGPEEHEEGRWPATFCVGGSCGAENRELEDLRPELTSYMYCLIWQTESI